MLLNSAEFLLMNNPVRKLIQSTLEISRLKKLVKTRRMGRVLEIGCGSGYGSQLIMKYFCPKKIIATDFDPRMIKIAQIEHSHKNIDFQVASATNLAFKDNTFDAVFDFGIIHHIPNWKKAIKEVTRVLKPGGLIIIEDLSIETFEVSMGKFFRKILDHPYKEMYKQEELLASLKTAGNLVIEEKTFHNLGIFRYFVVVAQKKATN